MKLQRIFGVVILSGVAACSVDDEAMLEIYAQLEPEECSSPPSAPGFAIVTPGDPAACRPAAVRADGLDVTVTLSSDGRAVGVATTIYLCIRTGPDGTVIPRYELDEATERCILKEMTHWQFMKVGT